MVRQPTVQLAGTVDHGVDQDGRSYAKAAVVIPPRSSTSVTWVYDVPQRGRPLAVTR